VVLFDQVGRSDCLSSGSSLRFGIWMVVETVDFSSDDGKVLIRVVETMICCRGQEATSLS